MGTVTDEMDTETLVEMTPEEKREFFDEQAQIRLGMSGEEFLGKYEAGYWPDLDAEPHLMYMAMLLPYAQAA